MCFGAEAGVPAQCEAGELRRFTITDEQAEGERVGKRDGVQLGGGGPGSDQVPALERAPEDRVWMALARYRTDVRIRSPIIP